MIMVSDKNENFRIYLTTAFIQMRNKKVEKMGGGSRYFEISWKGFVGWKSLGTTALDKWKGHNCFEWRIFLHDIFHKAFIME
jgi:hypothetical protein